MKKLIGLNACVLLLAACAISRAYNPSFFPDSHLQFVSKAVQVHPTTLGPGVQDEIRGSGQALSFKTDLRAIVTASAQKLFAASQNEKPGYDFRAEVIEYSYDYVGHRDVPDSGFPIFDIKISVDVTDKAGNEILSTTYGVEGFRGRNVAESWQPGKFENEAVHKAVYSLMHQAAWDLAVEAKKKSSGTGL